MNLKRLEVFRAVVQYGSFSEAAEALSYTQPAVSHHISQLEVEIGAKVLERDARGNRLTPAGRILMDHACEILDRVESAKAEMAEVVGSGGGRLRLGSFASASVGFLPTVIGEIRRDFPGLRIQLREGEPTETVSLMRAQEIDIGIVFDSERHQMDYISDLNMEPLFDDPLLVALPANHPLAQVPALRLQDLRDELWIEGAGAMTPCSLILADVCREAGFEPRRSFNCGNYQVVRRLVESEVGIALVPWLATIHDQGELVFRHLGPEGPTRRVCLLTGSSNYRPSSVQSTIKAIKEAACEVQNRLSHAAPDPSFPSLMAV